MKNTPSANAQRNRRNRQNLVSYQTPNTVAAVATSEVETEETGDEDTEDSKVEDYVLNGRILGEIREGNFTIKVMKDGKDDKGKKVKVVAYQTPEGESETFSYKHVSSFPNLLIHLGGKLDDDQITMLGTSLVVKDKAGNESEDSVATGKAVAKLLDMINTKLRSDAKNNAYQALVNKHKPLEGAQRDTAVARTIATIMKLGNISAESAIEVLKLKGAVPQEYTVEDFEATPLRRTGADKEED